MIRNQTLLVLALLLAVFGVGCRAATVDPPAIPERSIFYTFEKYAAGNAPANFAADASDSAVMNADMSKADSQSLALGVNDARKPGKWVVLNLKDAAGGAQVLAQLDANNAPGRTPIAWVRNVNFGSGVVVSVDGRSHERDGLVDVGVAWCVRDANEYLVLHADGEAGELRIESFQRGKTTRLATGKFRFEPHHWYSLVLEQDGSDARAGINGTIVVEAKIPRDFQHGSVGLCTFEGVTAEFDNFSVVGKPLAR
ncbi:MAG: hypothetical protein HY286_18155 [Planctomycetes bacterium]|nr:hypothetical protein [Planctomycetota bacterium]